MFQTRLKTTFTLLFLGLALAASFLIGPVHSASASTAPNFSLSISPASQSIPRAQDALYTVKVQALNGFTGTVSFTLKDDLDHTGGTFSPTSVTGTGHTTLDMRASADAPLATTTITVTGTSGSLQHTASAIFSISDTAPDFALSINPTAQTIHKGTSAVYTVQVQDLHGFAGTVVLSIDHGPSPDSFSLNPTSVTGNGTSTFTIQTNSQSNLGTFTLFIFGDSAGLEHEVQVNYTVIS